MDVVGIGALNLDHVVHRSSEGLPVARGTEGRVPAEVVSAHLGGKPAPGGSAFNTVVALASLDPGLRLGYVGVTGSVTAHVDRLAELGVDHRFVHRVAGLGGTCVSVVEDDDRTLLIHPGANDRMGDFLDAAVADYLIGARIVHVTSFLDSSTPMRLAALARIIRARGVQLSLDPGHEWASAPSAAVLDLIGQADHLFLNSREFEALGNRARCPGTVIVKSAEGVRTFHGGSVEFTAHVPLPPAEVVNPTGAGDVFAAGYLAAQVSSRLSPDEGAALGLTLARRHLTRPD